MPLIYCADPPQRDGDCQRECADAGYEIAIVQAHPTGINLPVVDSQPKAES